MSAWPSLRRRSTTDRRAVAARAAAQASGVAHMGAHALGAAAYAAKAAALATPDDPGAFDAELEWQLARLDPSAREALRRLPQLGEDGSGPLGTGLLTTGTLGEAIRTLQARL
ncbi:putative immunity protein [Leifsonia williamsii]|uniref:putative immunity protein n=1 Tax=Leifsonia williamsii TaxID=3035919 RepID=UPI003440673A